MPPDAPTPPRRRFRRAVRRTVLLAGLAVAGCCGPPSALWVRAWFRDRPAPDDIPPGFADDASRLNLTKVTEVWPVPADPARAEDQLRDLLRRAQARNLPVSVAGARHSMGGHTIAPGGVVIDMLPFRALDLDADRNVLCAGAGARWADVIPFLDARGLSVAVMQSNSDFSVGGSLSVNCHGWQHDRPPVASTVESFRLMTADGTVRRCSRTENADLFSLALGGYGLFGVILDAELRVVPNERYTPVSEVLPTDRYVARHRELAGPDAGMVMGRLCVVPGGKTFLREALLTVWRRAPCGRAEIPALNPAAFAGLRRQVYRAQIGSDAGKEVRWRAETLVAGRLAGAYFSRNQLLSEGADVYRERNADRTDILHEYFVPPGQFEAFLARVREVVPRHGGDLLNVTVRTVAEDRDTALRYADRDLVAFVMLFNQSRDADSDARAAVMTRELIDAALGCGGRYYLPYRPHATREQFASAYPQAAAVFERKRHFDPAGVFRNQFFEAYGPR
ncbi:FAD-binding oxidoreductase [bacterium]|nr:FAD-binding oxidoreductase [bacterium]